MADGKRFGIMRDFFPQVDNSNVYLDVNSLLIMMVEYRVMRKCQFGRWKENYCLFLRLPRDTGVSRTGSPAHKAMHHFFQRCQATKSWLAKMKSLKLAAKRSLEAKQEWVRILLLEGVLWIRKEAGSAPTRQKSNIASNNPIWKQHKAQQAIRIGIFFLLIKSSV